MRCHAAAACLPRLNLGGIRCGASTALGELRRFDLAVEALVASSKDGAKRNETPPPLGLEGRTHRPPLADYIHRSFSFDLCAFLGGDPTHISGDTVRYGMATSAVFYTGWRVLEGTPTQPSPPWHCLRRSRTMPPAALRTLFSGCPVCSVGTEARRDGGEKRCASGHDESLREGWRGYSGADENALL